MRLAVTATLVVLALAAPTRVASAQTASLEPAVARAAERACGARGARLESAAGPWAVPGAVFWAAVYWRQGAANACLVMLAQRAGRVAVVGRGRIPAGASQRYGERYAPTLRDTPLWLAGRMPMPVTDAVEMGAGGGGGTLTSAWMARGDVLSSVFAQVLDGVTDINASVETPCDANDALMVVATGGAPARLEFTECFDGRLARRSLRFDGRRFVP